MCKAFLHYPEGIVVSCQAMMNIQKLPISKLNPAKYNPRKDLKPGEKEYDRLRRSIEEFGYVEPVIYNNLTGNVVGGHQRLKVLLDLGHTEIDCVVVELDNEREKALNIALNKISGDWDMPKLKDLLEELDTNSFDVTLTGFEAEEIKALTPETSIIDLDELLKEVDMSTAIESPIWIVIRTAKQNLNLVESALATLVQSGIRIERSYGE